jgi:hypothetical protein
MYQQTAAAPIRSTVPARLDRLPWSSFHWRVIVALGITWVLDDFEITLHLTSSQVGFDASLYLFGEAS